MKDGLAPDDIHKQPIQARELTGVGGKESSSSLLNNPFKHVS